MKPFRYVAALALGAAGLVLGAVVGPPAAALSCVTPATVLDEAEVILAGHVVESRDGRILVTVDEVWRGDDVPAQLWLTVDLPEWSAWAGPDGEVPDGQADPRRWVFAPARGAIGPCTAWRPSGELRHEILRHRPDDAAAPVAADAEAPYENVAARGAAPWWPWYAAGGAVALLAVFGAVLRRRVR